MKLAVGICVAVVLLVLAVWIFLILPRIRNAADRELIGVHYAHRGLHGENVPENSLAAFALARNAGYGIELDVRLSRDRRVMVFHDDTLKRMCGVDRRVEELTCAELQSLRLAGSDQTIPTLDQVLALIGGRVPLLIELKGTGRDESPLCKRVSKLLDDYAGAFAIESFNPMILSWFRNYRPRFARGILVTRTKPGEGRGPDLPGRSGRRRYFTPAVRRECSVFLKKSNPDKPNKREVFYEKVPLFFCGRYSSA